MSVDSLSCGPPLQGKPSICSLKALSRGALTLVPGLAPAAIPDGHGVTYPLTLRKQGGATLTAGDVT